MTSDDLRSSWLGSIPVGQVVAWIVAVAAFLIILWRMYKRLKPLDDFLTDWNGEPARPGVPRRPGVMERLETMERYAKDAPTRSEFTALEHTVAKNTGAVKAIGEVLNIGPADGEDET